MPCTLRNAVTGVGCAVVNLDNMACSVPVYHFANGRMYRRFGVLLLVAGLMAGCAAAPTPQGIQDPNESANRSVHNFNVGVDRVLLRPASQVYGTVVPRPVRNGISNFSENLDEPGAFINHLLQGRVDLAAQNALRFAVNTTAGVGGLMDAASWLGMPEATTDFGETLHRWGAAEGNYVELPLTGPSTTRDSWGSVVDIVLNPLTYAQESAVTDKVLAADTASTIGQRYTFSETIDSVLYDSADSYAQARLLYLQNRRFELGQEVADDNFEDPYEDPYAE
jgi:phospholipid-binding lipoprotein MlaA